MARPSARPPTRGRVDLPAVPPAHDEPPVEQEVPELQPSADNGVPYGDKRPQDSAATVRRELPRRPGQRQISARLPDDLYQRFIACAQGTRIPQGRLVERALDVELKAHGY